MSTLHIYLTRHCFGCGEGIRLAEEIRQRMPGLEVLVKYLEELPESEVPLVIATPSYFLNGSRIFLGNPRLEELIARVNFLQSEAEEIND